MHGITSRLHGGLRKARKQQVFVEELVGSPLCGCLLPPTVSFRVMCEVCGSKQRAVPVSLGMTACGGVLHSQPLRYRCWGSGQPHQVFLLYLLVLEDNFPCQDRLWEEGLPGFGRSVCHLCVRQDLEVQAVCSRNGVDQLLTVPDVHPAPHSLPFPLCLGSVFGALVRQLG